MQQTGKTGWIMMLLIFMIPHILFSQDLAKRITLRMHDTPLPEVLKKITELSGVTFSYNPASLPMEKRISVNLKNKTVKEVLEAVFRPNGIDYAVVENQVVLKPAGNGDSAVPGREKKAGRSFPLSGFLYDKTTGEVLIGANVYVKGTSQGATTNGYGFFSMRLPEGSYTMIFSYVGYQQAERLVELDQPVRISMEDAQLQIREVEITADEKNSDIHTRQMSDISFSQKTLGRLPGFGGDIDVIRALQSVPGIQTYGDGSSLYYVRGGNSDQNLMLIDEVPVYNPSHLFGFFSAFSPDAINSVQVYKGDFPAKYGGRLSSVIDIKAREGNMKNFGISGNIGPYTSNLSVEGPIVKNRSSFIISGRVSTLNWLKNLPVFNQSFGFQFFDVNAKLNYILNKNNRLFLTFYYGLDDFNRYNSVEVNSLGINWHNLAGTFRWNHIYSDRLFSNTTLNFSRYNYSLNLPQETSGYWNSEIANVTLKSDASWFLNLRNTLRSGVEVTYHYSNPGNVTLTDGSASPTLPVVSEYHSMEYVFYLSNEQLIGKKLSVRYGIRLPVWQDFGPADVYYFDANHKVIDTIGYGTGRSYFAAFSPEPRVNVQYQIAKGSCVKGSYTRSTQFLQLLSNSTSPFNSLEVWAPAGPNIKPQIADQLALGYFRDFRGQKFSASAEGYYKWFGSHIDYRDHANLLFNPLIESELRAGKGWSYGIELMLRKVTGNLTGWIGYTWSRAFLQTPGVNQDASYPANYDRPHNVCFNICYDDKKHWLLAANWIYMTGAATSTPTGFYMINQTIVPVYGEKNNDRLPDYHRLDLSATYQFGKPGNRYHHSLAVTLYNAYGRYNPFTVSFNKMLNDHGDFVVPSNLSGNYQLIPTTMSVAGVIPSINYQFRF